MPTPDRDLDAEVAEMMGAVLSEEQRKERFIYRTEGTVYVGIDGMARTQPAAYSSDIAAAFTILDLFDEVDLHKGPHGWLCRLERGPDGAVQYGESLRAETAMLAICRAALQAATRSAAESDA